jgi:mRNA-degrading endonuclease toxin of MazEF toxin-antitoxin module
MTAADGIHLLEARADALNRGKRLAAIGLVIIAAFLLGVCASDRGGGDADLRALEKATANAQRERHAAAVAIIAATHAADSAKASADSIERRATIAETKSRQLAQQVRAIDATHLAVRLTPTGPESVTTVLPPVTAYIASLEQTVAAKDSALQARDGQAAADATEKAALRRELAADSVTIDNQKNENDALKRDRPRFGLKTGLAVGAAAVALLAHLLR